MKNKLEGTLGEIQGFVKEVEDAVQAYKKAIENLPRDTKKIREEFEEAVKDISQNAMERTMEEVEIYQKAFDLKEKQEKNAAFNSDNLIMKIHLIPTTIWI